MIRAVRELFPELRENAEQLYQSCVSSLDRTSDLWQAAQEMTTDEGRQRVLESRESLIAEVGLGIHHLGATLDYLQASRLEKSPQRAQLTQIRRELETGLEIARRVEGRIDSLERSLDKDSGV